MNRRQLLASTGAVALASLATVAATGGTSKPMNWDIFWIGGQSNATGQGDAVQSPDIVQRSAYEYEDTETVLKHLNDPVGKANNGSAWPAFHKEYYEETGRKAIYISKARSASGMVWDTNPTADKSWSSQGNLRGEALTQIQNCQSFLDGFGHNYTLRGSLWSQGEQDAQAIDDGTITKSQYKTEFQDLISYFRTELGQSDYPFWIFETGHENTGDTTGYQQVRDAQQEIADNDENVYLVSQKQKEFPEQGLMEDTYHYTQEGYNEMGRTGARSVAEIAASWAVQ